MGTIDRRPYLTATVLDQNLLDQSQDNLTGQLRMVAEVETPTGTIYLSDRATYVGSTYYEPRVIFPEIRRTVGDWLANEVQFSSLTLEINNADGKFNEFLPGGANYNGWLQRAIIIKLGVGETASTYSTIFRGKITDVEGFQRNTTTFTLIARDDFEKVSVNIPSQFLIEADWPDIEDNFIGLGAPIIYGDWTTELRIEGPEIPAYPVNGNDIAVNASLEDPSAGDTALRLVISSTAISFFDDTSVTLFRGDKYYTFDSSDISIVPATNNTVFDITQKNLIIDGDPWIYESGDEFFLKVKGVDLGIGNLDNIVLQAKDILEQFAGLSVGDFDANWTTYATKASPAQSNIVGIKSRVWQQETATALQQSLSLLEQVRLEAFIDRNGKFKISSLQFEDWQTSPSHTVKNWDLKQGSFLPKLDPRNNFNRAKADFAFSPAKGQNKYSTPVFRNQSAITQASNRTIGKNISLPNLYIRADAVNQLIEIIRLASSYSEMIDLILTPRALLQDIGGFVGLDVTIGSIQMRTIDGVVGLIREIGYNPQGEIPAKIWAFQMINYPGYSGPSGTVGGYNAIITQEL